MALSMAASKRASTRCSRPGAARLVLQADTRAWTSNVRPARFRAKRMSSPCAPRSNGSVEASAGTPCPLPPAAGRRPLTRTTLRDDPKVAQVAPAGTPCPCLRCRRASPTRDDPALTPTPARSGPPAHPVPLPPLPAGPFLSSPETCIWCRRLSRAATVGPWARRSTISNRTSVTR